MLRAGVVVAIALLVVALLELSCVAGERAGSAPRPPAARTETVAAPFDVVPGLLDPAPLAGPVLTR